jgi:hypothetical protein
MADIIAKWTDRRDVCYGLIGLACVVILWLQSRYVESQLLRGFWCADLDFCQIAGLDKFILYIGDTTLSGRSGYMLVANTAGIIINNPIKLSTTSFTINPLVRETVTSSACLEWFTDATFAEKADHDEDAFVSKCQLDFNPTCGKLTFYTADTVHVVLYKDAAAIGS